MNKQNNKGSILVLVLLVSSVIISTSTALLSTSVLNYKMKRLNSRVKKAFYTAEGALEEAYAIAMDHVEAGVEYADGKECSNSAYLNFLMGRCDDLTDQKGLVDTLKDKGSYSIYNVSNITVDANLTDETDYLQLEITSSCMDEKIEKRIKLICRIPIPYKDSDKLICIHDWVSER